MRYVVALALLVTGIGLPNVTAAQSLNSSLEVDASIQAWLGCVRANSGEFRGKIINFGPKAQVNGTRGMCVDAMERTRVALRARQIEAGLSATSRDLDVLMKSAKASVIEVWGKEMAGGSSSVISSSPASLGGSFADTQAPQRQAKPLKGSVNKGLAAYNAGDHETAYARWLPKAQAGDSAAQNNMGLLFSEGLSTNTPQNDEMAASYFLAAARQGHTTAMRNLAQLQIRSGQPEVAATWLNLAAVSEAQVAIQQAQVQPSIGFAIGCALAGGCAQPGVQPRPAPPPPTNCRINGTVWGDSVNARMRCQ